MFMLSLDNLLFVTIETEKECSEKTVLHIKDLNRLRRRGFIQIVGSGIVFQRRLNLIKIDVFFIM